MKTETQIAEENINWLKDNKGFPSYKWYEIVSGEHKATLQRFLDFLEKTPFGFHVRCKECNIAEKNVKEKITDIKQAIKLYSEQGI